MSPLRLPKTTKKKEALADKALEDNKGNIPDWNYQHDEEQRLKEPVDVESQMIEWNKESLVSEKTTPFYADKVWQRLVNKFLETGDKELRTLLDREQAKCKRAVEHGNATKRQEAMASFMSVEDRLEMNKANDLYGISARRKKYLRRCR